MRHLFIGRTAYKVVTKSSLRHTWPPGSLGSVPRSVAPPKSSGLRAGTWSNLLRWMGCCIYRVKAAYKGGNDDLFHRPSSVKFQIKGWSMFFIVICVKIQSFRDVTSLWKRKPENKTLRGSRMYEMYRTSKNAHCLHCRFHHGSLVSHQLMLDI